MGDKYGLSKKQIALYRATFKSFDKDNDGQIDATDFKEVLKKYQIYMTDEEIINEINKYDKNGNKTIDFDEFLCILTGTSPDNTTDNNQSINQTIK